MIVRFQTFRDRNKLWNKLFELEGRTGWMKEDFPNEIEQKRQRLYPIMKDSGTLKPQSLCSKRTEKCIGFCGRDSVFVTFTRPLSQQTT